MEPLDASPEDDGVSTFVSARSRMFAAAFRMLGDAAEAEDVVQEAWLRWQAVQRELVRNPPAFLMTTSRRLAINWATGARTRYETPFELQGAEPADPNDSPGTLVERGQALEAALLVVLERLSASERAAYLLREAFNYSYRRIGRVLHLSEANSRQLAARARKRIVDGPRSAVDSAELRRFVVAFSDATRTGDLAGLEALLAGAASHRAPRSDVRSSKPDGKPPPAVGPSRRSLRVELGFQRWQHHHLDDDALHLSVQVGARQPQLLLTDEVGQRLLDDGELLLDLAL